MTNPLLQEWTGPFDLPPFAQITDDHFGPALEQGLTEARALFDKIAENPEPPSFDNTIAELERPGLLNRVARVFFNYAAADANPAREALQRDVSPKFAALNAEMVMNAALFARIEALMETRNSLDPDQARVLELYHRQFVRSGARLTGKDRDRLKEVMERLASIGTQFTQNVLQEERAWALQLSKKDVTGLPDFLTDALAAAATARGEQGHTLTLSPSVIEPFLSHSPRRDLRETVHEAWKVRGQQGGETDNADLVAETLALRAERASLLGFESFADFKLDTEMAKTPDAVRDLLMSVWKPARNRFDADRDALTEYLRADGINDDLKSWDWLYYAEKRRQAEFDIDEAEVKPYLSLDAMREAAFGVAHRLFGLNFTPKDITLYHPDARAWEVTRDGAHMGLFIGDYFARPSKRSGAWCSNFRDQSNIDTEIRSVAVNVCNFAKGPEGGPHFLSFDDARTLFHEFGHALHHLLSNQRYPMISGTNVPRDFVELPSQLYEHWMEVPEILSEYARHAKTGDPMPPEMIARLSAAANADQGRETVSYISSALVDLDFHCQDAPKDPLAAEQEALTRIDMPEGFQPRHMAAHFKHVFSGDGYSAGYYSYMWSEVMDADAFSAFQEVGDPFDAELAEKLSRHIYSAGHSDDPARLYTAFRGAMPKVDALLKKRGLAA